MAKEQRHKPKPLPGDKNSLPDAELEVLACLWRHGKATARELRETMHGYRPMAHGSMATLLSRLQAKRLVTRKKGPVGKAFVYKPTRRAGVGYRRVINNLLQRIFGGNSVALVTSLFETQPPTHDELEELQRLIDDLRKGRERRNR